MYITLRSILFILFSLFFIGANVALSNVIAYDEHGYYIDERNQIDKEPIKVDCPENIKVYPAATTVPFGKYVQVKTGEPARASYKEPYVAGYNVNFSNRRAYSHTKDQFIQVFCTANKSSNGMDCYDDKYAITFVDVADWSYGVMKAPLKAKMHGRKPILFLMVHNLGADAEYMSEANRVADSVNLPVVFATIDTYIPRDRVP